MVSFSALCGCDRAGDPAATNPKVSPSRVESPQSVAENPAAVSDVIAAQQSFDRGDFLSAKAAAQKALLQSPDDVDTLQLLAQINAATYDYAAAADVYGQLASREISGRLNLLLQAFDWNARAGRFDEAETNMLRAIEWGIDDSRATQVLCQLYTFAGEAA